MRLQFSCSLANGPAPAEGRGLFSLRSVFSQTAKTLMESRGANGITIQVKPPPHALGAYIMDLIDKANPVGTGKTLRDPDILFLC